MTRAAGSTSPSRHVSADIDPTTPPEFLEPRSVAVDRQQQPSPELAAVDEAVKTPSFGGHGTLEALRVSQALEERGIACCFCGVSALIYYGAGRVRDDWEICVPSERIHEAELVFRTEPYSRDYVNVAPWTHVQPGSSIHTYPRFQGRGLGFYFILVPSYDIHLSLDPSGLQRSHNGLPYPELHVLIQSFLDTNDTVSLCDVVDGSDVSEQWGVCHLNLEGTSDAEWAAWKNKAIEDRAGGEGEILGGCVPTRKVARRELWKWVVTTKTGRLGWTRPESLFSTRFRLRGSPDPWTMPRPSC